MRQSLRLLNEGYHRTLVCQGLSEVATVCTALLPEYAFAIDATTDSGRAILQQLAATTLRSKLAGLSASPLAALAVSARTAVAVQQDVDVHAVKGGSLSDAVLVSGATFHITSQSLALASSAAVAYEGADAVSGGVVFLYYEESGKSESTRAVASTAAEIDQVYRLLFRSELCVLIHTCRVQLMRKDETAIKLLVAQLVRAGAKTVVMSLHPLSTGLSPLLRHWLLKAKLDVCIMPRKECEVRLKVCLRSSCKSLLICMKRD